jgi:hypothetical protein
VATSKLIEVREFAPTEEFEFENSKKEIEVFFEAVAVAFCPIGDRAISGGSAVEGKEVLFQMSEREPEFFGPGEAWGVFAEFNKLEGGAEAIAYCVPENSAVVGSPAASSQRHAKVAAWKRSLRARAAQRHALRTH